MQSHLNLDPAMLQEFTSFIDNNSEHKIIISNASVLMVIIKRQAAALWSMLSE